MLDVRWAVTGPFQENSYLLLCSDTKQAILVDPGDDAADLEQLICDAGAKVVAIYATHGHIDHVGAVAELQDRLCVPTYAPAGDQPWLDALPMQAQMFRLGPKRVPRVDHDLKDGDVIRFGKIEGRAIATPGHTQGGTCLWFEAERVLVTGDTLFVRGVGRTDLPGGDYDTLEASITQRLFTLPDDVTFYSGHGDPGRLGDEKRFNPFVGAAGSSGARVPRMP